MKCFFYLLPYAIPYQQTNYKMNNNNANTNTNATTISDIREAPSSFDSRLRAHYLAVQQATKTIQNSYRFIQEMAPTEDVYRLCAVLHDHIERISAAENIPPQMRAYEMALESAQEFMLIPEDATPIEVVDILKTTLEPTELRRSFAVEPESDELCVQLPSLTPSHAITHELLQSSMHAPSLVPGYNYESPENMHSLIFDYRLERDNRPIQQDYYSLGPRKLFSDDESEDGDEV